MFTTKANVYGTINILNGGSMKYGVCWLTQSYLHTKEFLS